MISPAIFKKHGCDAESLRKLFTIPLPDVAGKKSKKKGAGAAASLIAGGDLKGEPSQYMSGNDLGTTETGTGESEGIVRLRRLLYSRIQEGRQNNLRDYKIYAAIDYAYDAPFHQTTPTLIQHVLDQKMTYEESKKIVEGWGLVWSDVFRVCYGDDNSTILRNSDGTVKYAVNAPSLVRTLIPLVKAYVTVRVAKLYTDRDQIPLFKFEAIRSTERNKILCEVLTSITEAMVTQFGYRAELKDIILHTLLYGICMTFPQEAWYVEKQEQEDGKTVIVKEGLRYLQPHPTRFFYDLMYRTSSLNSDTGCTFSGHWRIVRFGDIYWNKDYFNKQVIPFGTNWFQSSLAGNYFSDFYPCTAQFPSCQPLNGTDREQRAAIYTLDDQDRAIFLTDMLCKLVPADWGMGTYDKPVWFRFVMASDDTVIYAEPLAYTPNVYYGYDADGARVRNASMALELIPFQDQLGNILSQILLTAKQNLANVTFFDKNIINAQQIKSLQNAGETIVRGLNFVEFDSEKNAMAGLNTKEAFHTMQFAKLSTAELTNTLNTVISLAERMLSFSAQELGGSASHQQSAQEIKTIAGNVGVRVAYTGTFIDDGIDAWKKQIADAAMAYMDSGFVALISPETPDLEKHLEELGFELIDKGGGRVKAQVKVKKSSIMPMILEGLASTRDGPDRGTDAQAATVQMQTWQGIAGNQLLAQQVGAKTIVKGMEAAAKLGGAGDGFKLDVTGEPVPQQPSDPQAQPAQQPDMNQMAQQIEQAAVQESMKQVGAMIEEQVVKPVAEQISQQGQAIQQLAQEVDAVAKGAAQAHMAIQKLSEMVAAAMQAPPAPSPTNYDSSPVPEPGVPPPVGAGPSSTPQLAGPP